MEDVAERERPLLALFVATIGEPVPCTEALSRPLDVAVFVCVTERISLLGIEKLETQKIVKSFCAWCITA